MLRWRRDPVTPQIVVGDGGNCEPEKGKGHMLTVSCHMGPVTSVPVVPKHLCGVALTHLISWDFKKLPLHLGECHLVERLLTD